MNAVSYEKFFDWCVQNNKNPKHYTTLKEFLNEENQLIEKSKENTGGKNDYSNVNI